MFNKIDKNIFTIPAIIFGYPNKFAYPVATIIPEFIVAQ